jgi:hypothetical protein
MSDWLHALPVVWMAVVVFGLTYLVAAAIYAAVVSLAARGYARSFKAVSPGMLPPLGIVFGLLSRSPRRRYGTTTNAPRRQSTAKPARSGPPSCCRPSLPRNRATDCAG